MGCQGRRVIIILKLAMFSRLAKKLLIIKKINSSMEGICGCICILYH
jgi:hypothetical protein